MISIAVTELNEYIDGQIQSARDGMDNEIENDTLTNDKAIRLSTKIKAFNIIRLYINKE